MPLAVFLAPFSVFGAEEQGQLRIVTVLGTEATIPYGSFSTDDPRLSEAMQRNLLLRIEENTYFVISRNLFRRAELVDKKHVVTLSTGDKLTGTLACSTEANGKIYSLSAAKRVEVVPSPTAKEEKEERAKKGDGETTHWELRADNIKDKVFVCSHLRFVARYGRITIVGSSYDYEVVLKKFYTQLDKEDVAINPEDFLEISFNERNVSLKSPSGVVTSGEAFFKQDRGDSDKAYYAYLVLDMVDKDGVSVVLTRPKCVLTRESRATKQAK